MQQRTQFSISDLNNIDFPDYQRNFYKYFKSLKSSDDFITSDCYLIARKQLHTVLRDEYCIVYLVDHQQNRLVRKIKCYSNYLIQSKIRWIRISRWNIGFRTDLKPVIAMGSFIETFGYKPPSLIDLSEISRTQKCHALFGREFQFAIKECLSNITFKESFSIISSQKQPPFLIALRRYPCKNFKQFLKYLKGSPMYYKKFIKLNLQNNSLETIDSGRNQILRSSIVSGHYNFLRNFWLKQRTLCYLFYRIKGNQKPQQKMQLDQPSNFVFQNKQFVQLDISTTDKDTNNQDSFYDENKKTPRFGGAQPPQSFKKTVKK